MEHAIAPILVRLSRTQHGLYPDDSLAIDLGITDPRVVDVPMSEQELRRSVSLVRHANVVREHEGALTRFGIGKRELRANHDADSIGGLFIPHHVRSPVRDGQGESSGPSSEPEPTRIRCVR